MSYRLTKVIGLFVIGAALMVADLTIIPGSIFGVTEAVIGRPLTPVSVAGVARRTTRRTVYAAGAYGYASPYGYASAPTTVVVSDSGNSYQDQQTAEAQQQAAWAQQEAAEAQKQAAQAQEQAALAQQQAALPIGSTVPSLPANCGSSTVDGQSYFSCSGTWYRPAMQNGAIVYLVVANPS